MDNFKIKFDICETVLELRILSFLLDISPNSFFVLV